MNKKLLYLSGPMTGVKDLNRQAFAKYSITKCKRCAAKASASRRKEKRNEDKTR